MSDLTAFLLARIAEDEEVASALVLPPHDGYKPHPALSEWQYESGGEVEYAQTPEMLAHRYPDTLYVTCDGEGLRPSVDDAAGEHIARHDPARVLRECEAKRRIVYISENAADRRPPKGDGYEEARARYTLRLLASFYSDHPDYREDWRP